MQTAIDWRPAEIARFEYRGEHIGQISRSGGRFDLMASNWGWMKPHFTIVICSNDAFDIFSKAINSLQSILGDRPVIHVNKQIMDELGLHIPGTPG